MVTYVVLMKYTPQGMAAIKDAPKRLEAQRAAVEKAGGHMIGTWLTMGQYDLVSIAELPSDEVAAQMALELGRLGNVKTEGLRAFSEEEFAGFVSRMS